MKDAHGYQLTGCNGEAQALLDQALAQFRCLHAASLATTEAALQASLAAARLRFRPILMTSLAFILGVVPLYVSTGASSASQREIGTGVFWGMTIGTSLAVIFVPVFFLVVRTLFRGKQEREHDREIELEENDSHDHPSGPKEVMIP